MNCTRKGVEQVEFHHSQSRPGWAWLVQAGLIWADMVRPAGAGVALAGPGRLEANLARPAWGSGEKCWVSGKNR